MTKQDIYQQLFWKGLVHIRNVQSQSFLKKGRDKSSYFIAELLHNLHASMFIPEYTDHDIWFINNQVRYFINNCSSKILSSYLDYCDLLLLLVEDVPNTLKSQIDLTFSDELRLLIHEFRNKNHSVSLDGFTLGD